MQEIIARTGFLVSLTSYLFFWALDLARPGFVARFFSVHIFLVCTMFFGLWWSRVVTVYNDRAGLERIFRLVCGVFLAVLTWSLTGVFGFERGGLTLIAFFVPWIVLKLIRSK